MSDPAAMPYSARAGNEPTRKPNQRASVKPRPNHGLVNVNLTDVTVQIPIALAANWS